MNSERLRHAGQIPPLGRGPSRKRGAAQGRPKAAARLAVLLFFVVPAGYHAAGQVRQALFEIHNRGEVWETVKDNGTVGAPNPTNRFEYHPSLDWPGGPADLTSKDEQRSYHAGGGMWIGGKKPGGAVFFTENGPLTYVDLGTFEPIVKTANHAGSPGFDPARAEESITASWGTTEGMHVTRVSRTWSYRPYRSSLLMEYRVRNAGTETLSEVFIGFPYLFRPSYQDFVVHNGWGDDFNRTDDLAGYDSTLRMLYVYDDTPNFSLPNDVGNYYAAVNELRTTGYVGISIVSADASSDARPQPGAVLVAQLLNNERNLTLTSASRENLYAILNGSDRSLQALPDTRLSAFTLLSCGPYSMAPGDSVRIVVAVAVNGLPIDQAVQGLALQSSLPAGLDSLRAALRRASELAAAGFRAPAVPPPSPEVEILPLPTSKSISLTWPPLEQTYRNPLTGRSDVRGYRIYRSDRSFTGPFTQIRRISIGSPLDQSRFYDSGMGRWQYVDQTISLGVGYFYAVTTDDSTGQESWLTNRNTQAIRATNAPAPDPLGVKVFPNPFRRVSGFPTSGEERSIVWTNLPALCTIRIYTSGGELVKTMRHENAVSGEEVWDQLTDARQRTAPGIYFWTVESETGSARGTLLILK
jgi:hypothetical protein